MGGGGPGARWRASGGVQGQRTSGGRGGEATGLLHLKNPEEAL